MNDADKEKSPLSDRVIHIVIVSVVLAGLIVPYLLKGAEYFLDWTPPPALKTVLDWLPPKGKF